MCIYKVMYWESNQTEIIIELQTHYPDRKPFVLQGHLHKDSLNKGSYIPNRLSLGVRITLLLGLVSLRTADRIITAIRVYDFITKSMQP